MSTPALVPPQGDPHSDPQSDPHSDPHSDPPSRPRRPRTALLLVGALLLGPLLGGGIGYAIQQQRPPTPLPALLPVSAPAYPAGHLNAQDSAAIAPRPLAIDGDLRPLLLPKPSDAQDWDDFGIADAGDWATISELAMEYGKVADNFQQLASTGFRRAAVNTWQKDGVKYRIELIQYFSDNASSAINATLAAGVSGTPFGDTMEGAYEAPAQQETYAETTDRFYHGRALTRRGDLLVSVEAFGDAQVNADKVRELAKQQWERLA
ncbi:hypothetical protein [Kitasatospora kifunensis]|uniref:Uncharacterized protein n=1 Tax=Kitasatospora kifunensis TaxID=58351 RepID=A0A7W7R351_KITKI|nr:hypothetical protein [Kitasatospora kifunensis]MBB4924323.1 hypothetical protein [Kitasatospora kifunensis]